MRELEMGEIPQNKWDAPETEFGIKDDPAVMFKICSDYAFVMRVGAWAVEYFPNRAKKLTWGGDLYVIAEQVRAIDGDCYKEMFDKLHAEIVAHLAISERERDGPAIMRVRPLIADEWQQSTEEPPI